MLRVLSKPLVRFAERYVPNALFFAILLTAIVGIVAIAVTDITPVTLIRAWGDGLSALLAFMTQMALVLLLGHTLAHTRAVRWILVRFAALPRRPATAYPFVTLVTACFSLLNWGLGLVVGGIIVVEVARAARRRGMRLHYPLLAAASYSGWVIFQMGVSGTPPLAASTAGGIYAHLPGGIVHVSRTTFAPWNLIAIAVTVIAVMAAMAMLRPVNADDEVVEAPPWVMDNDEPHADRNGTSRDTPAGDGHTRGARDGDGGAGPAGSTPAPGSLAGAVPAATVAATAIAPPALVADAPTAVVTASGARSRTPAERVDRWRGMTLFLGVVLGLYLVAYYDRNGIDLTLDSVNWSVLCLILLIVGNIQELTELVSGATRTVGGVLIQYPLYAGILAMLSASGLGLKISHLFISISTARTFGVLSFLSAGVLNIFIPSAGGQFAVVAPIFAHAAHTLHVNQSVFIMSNSYGDQWSDMVQPFWAIPLLTVAGLRHRDIMGYTAVAFLVSGVVFAGTLLIVGAG